MADISAGDLALMQGNNGLNGNGFIWFILIFALMFGMDGALGRLGYQWNPGCYWYLIGN